MNYIKLAEEKGFAVLSDIDDRNTFTAQRIRPRDNGMEVYRTFFFRTCKCGRKEVVQLQNRNKPTPETCRKCNAYNMGRANYIVNASEKTIKRRARTEDNITSQIK